MFKIWESGGAIVEEDIPLKGLQVASTSRGSSGGAERTAAPRGGDCRTPSAPVPQIPQPNSVCRTGDDRGSTKGTPKVYAVREGDPLPEGYAYVVQDQPNGRTVMNSTETVDLSTPPEGAAQIAEDALATEKRRAADKRNLTRTTNKQVHATFTKEVKVSLAEGRQPVLNMSEDATHLKARWHSAAKECAYKLLDMTKENWKEYSVWDKGLVHRELIDAYKFDPPLDNKRVDKYLASHLRSSRAVWKAHWQKHGDDDRHPNCPEDAWAVLIKWWSTPACREVAAKMASRRKLAQNSSRTGRKTLVETMDAQVSCNLSHFLLFIIVSSSLKENGKTGSGM